MSRLTQACDRILEAGWLLCLIGGTLFFNIHSARGFEPDKQLLLKGFLLVMAAAWAVRTCEGFCWAGLRRWRPGPVVGGALLVLLSGVVSVVTSIDPWLSWQGSYLRRDGLVTLLIYLGFFAMLTGGLRTRSQVERLVSCIVLTLVPVCIYATLQRFGLDPRWGQLTVTWVGSTCGNAVALGAYLITALPFLGYRCVELLARWPALTGLQRLSLGLHGVLLLWIGAVLIWTAGRGPTVGLAAGLLFAGWTAARRAPRQELSAWDGLKALILVVAAFSGGVLALALLLSLWLPFPVASFAATVACVMLIGLGLLLGLYLRRGPSWLRLGLLWLAGGVVLAGAVLNIPEDRAAHLLPAPVYRGLQGWRQIPWVWRFSRILDPGRSTGKVRTLLWEGAVRQLQQGCDIYYPEGDLDGLRSARIWVGWGPDTQELTFPQVYPPELAALESRDKRVDRMHNQTFDLLTTTGILGLLSWHALVLAGLVVGLGLLGFRLGGRAVLGWLAGGALTAGSALALGAPSYAGVLLLPGGVLGLGLALPDSARPVPAWKAGLAMACLVTLVGHLIEVQVGFALVPSSLHLFCALALVQALARIPDEEPATPDPLFEAPAVACLLTFLTVEMLSPISYLSSVSSGSQIPSAGFILRTFLWANDSARSLDSPAGLLLLVASLAGCWGLTVGRPLTNWSKLALLVLPAGLPLLATLAGVGSLRQAYFWLWLLPQNATVSPDEAVAAMIAPFQTLVVIFAGTLAVGWVWLALSLPSAAPRSEGSVSRNRSWLLGPVLLILVGALEWSTVLRPALADILYAQATSIQKTQALQAGDADGWSLPNATLERAAELAPEVDMYWSFLGDYRGRQALLTSKPADRKHRTGLSRQAFVEARRVAPLEPNNALNMAMSSLRWAGTLDPADPLRPQLLNDAREEYFRALRMSPFDVASKVDVGYRLAEDFQDLESAERLYREAIATDSRYYEAYYGLASVLERRTRALPEGAAQRRSLLASAAAAAYAGVRLEPPGQTRDGHYRVMLQLYAAAGVAPPVRDLGPKR